MSENNNKKGEDRKVLYYIFRTRRRDSKTGEVLHAKDYGLKAWRIPIYAKKAA